MTSSSRPGSLQSEKAQNAAIVSTALSAGMSVNDYERQLASDIAQFYDDFYGYVMYAFPWGQKGTDLENETGPDEWQREQMFTVSQKVQQDPLGTIQDATASGHGVGKSAEVAWLVLWMMSTRPHLAGWVTANTQSQLKGKTWRELAVWHNRAINGHWFTWTASRFYQIDNPTTWGIDAIPWTEHNSEAFAGLHAQHVLMIMDEASGIADVIWEVSEGAMTTPRAMWFCFGNPTRNTGRFHDCFGKYKHRWTRRQVDSRRCKMTNKAKLEEWRQDHGEDSDFFRVRVRGMFPHTASNQLIGSQTAERARLLRLEEQDYIYQPLHIGCDPARYGDDESVISARQGRKHVAMKAYRGLDNMQLGALVARMFNDFREQGRPMGAIFVDGIGLGSGVVDYLEMLGYPVIDVNVGAKAEQEDLYYNKRVEMWVRYKEWLDAGADLIDDPELIAQTTAIEYSISPTKDQMRLERKEDMKARGLDSPDRAESIALTFAEPFAPMSVHSQYAAGSFEPEEY